MSVSLGRVGLWVNGVWIEGDCTLELRNNQTEPDPSWEEWPASKAHFLTEETITGSVTPEISADDYACWMEFAVSPTVYGEIVGGPFDGAQVPLDYQR